MKAVKNEKKIAKTLLSPVAAGGQTNPAKPAPTRGPVTIIEAKIDVGFGNNVFVRGHGAGLSWDRGTPLTCVEPGTWRWTGPVDDSLTFKLVLNDLVWDRGADVTITPGKRVEIVPAF